MHRPQKTTSPATSRRLRWPSLTVVVATMAIAITTLLAPPAAAQDNENERVSSGPGCAPDRPAIAHHAGGIRVALGRQTNAPIPCSTPTGWRTNEMGLVVTNSGTILLQPALPPTGTPIGALRSLDQGASWSFVSPLHPTFVYPFDSNLGLDRRTGRAFWITPGYKFLLAAFPPTMSQVKFSDDDGVTWLSGGNPIMRFAAGNADSMKIFAGAPTESMKHLLQGYPSVVYNCGGHKPLRCQTSQDGGLTWGPASDLPFPPELEPIQGPNHDCSNFGLNGVVGQDGTVYFGYTPCNRPYVAISHDEGGTWQAVQVADVETIGWGMMAVGIDAEENLYGAWVRAVDRLPYMSVSRDGGTHWSTPLMIGAPEVNEAAIPRLVAGKQGQVAVAYYGSENSPGAPFPPTCPGNATNCPGYENEVWNTYITESFNALASQPLLWSASLNDPAHPTWYGCTPSSTGVIRLDESAPFVRGPGFSSGCTSMSDYFGMDMAPDGTPWVGFPQACPGGLPVAGNPNCPSTLTGGSVNNYFSLVGRLLRAPGEAAEDNEH
jgi:hypothetical protein